MVQRPTKRFLTLGTHLYDDLCCELKMTSSAKTEVCIGTPE
jgi:hypothetical protein